jgi:uncharacterized membrane protein (DUF485 family)
MILDGLSELNWLAVVVATVAWFALGGIWYARPVMGRAWMRSIGMDPTGQVGRPSAMMFVWTLIAYFVTSIVIALIVAFTATDDVGDALVLGVTLGVGFGLASSLVTGVYEQKSRPLTYTLINGIYLILAFAGVSLILALWP